jgi:hypothetical protein
MPQRIDCSGLGIRPPFAVTPCHSQPQSEPRGRLAVLPIFLIDFEVLLDGLQCVQKANDPHLCNPSQQQLSSTVQRALDVRALCPPFTDKSQVKSNYCLFRDHQVRSAETISVRAACQPGARPAKMPTIADTRIPVAANIHEGWKAIVTASAPTER